ncbi:MAG: hypothetical protein LH606_22550 [Cytophagaceae bacterium]|nr:hypothetical protein [Cytophagaceae bacterium]
MADPNQIAKEIDAFNAVAKEECLKIGIAFIDITPMTRTARNDPAYSLRTRSIIQEKCTDSGPD